MRGRVGPCAPRTAGVRARVERPCEWYAAVAMQESLRILIVDDEPATRLVMERALAQVGYVSTVEANSAEAARRVLAGATDIGGR